MLRFDVYVFPVYHRRDKDSYFSKWKHDCLSKGGRSNFSKVKENGRKKWINHYLRLEIKIVSKEEQGGRGHKKLFLSAVTALP